MKWKRLGRIFSVDALTPWMHSHATLPIASHIEGDRFRIYFSTRDVQNRSHGSYIEIDLKNPQEILAVAKDPLLAPGKLGYFDDSGVSMSCYVPELNLFYYMGWNLPKTVPFSNQIGAAKFRTQVSLDRFQKLPLVSKTEAEPLSFGYPWVLKVGKIYRMWYDTIFEWKENSTQDYRFELRSAISKDGIVWEKEHQVLIPLQEQELAIARPCVIQDKDCFKMWYSVNHSGLYRLSYAESIDGMNWTKQEALAGLKPGNEDWESDEITYPYVFDHKGKRYMLYNGNKYGKTGFGLAEIEDE